MLTDLNGTEENGELVYRGRNKRYNNSVNLDEDIAPVTAEDEYIEYIKGLSHLSATALEHHIKSKHAKKLEIEEDEYANWSICEDVGFLISFNCCIKKRISRI